MIGPDAMEEDNADEIDNIVPSYGYQRMPIVALGGSAGSIPALKTFFQALPPNTSQAYVVIVHLSPEHESTLSAILQTATVMPVAQAENGEKLEPDRVYVIPPGKHLTVVDGHLEPNRGKITLRSRQEPGRIVVEVTDTGIGLEPGVGDRIFKPFEQADATIAGEFGGLGLGLSISRATVEAHGGELSVSSPGRNQGATFTVNLPAGSAS